MGRPRNAMVHLRSGTLGAQLANRVRARRSIPPRLFKRPTPGAGGASARRLEALRAAIPDATAYLEIGLWAGRTFQNVGFPLRVGVDPQPRFDLDHLPRGAEVHVMPSDEFFKRDRRHFDVVFLDGLHTFGQTYRDLIHALDRCRHGAILVDDVVPFDEISAMPDLDGSLAERRRRGLPRMDGAWQGDVYKVVEAVHRHHPELEHRVIVGPSNPQAVVWRRDPSAVVEPADDAVLREVDGLQYEDVFSNGVPAHFHPTPEPEAISAVAAAVCRRQGEA